MLSHGAPKPDLTNAEHPAAEGFRGQGVSSAMTGLVQPFLSTVAGSLDSKGRVCIPASLIEHAGLKDRIVFVGKAQKFQIWDADRYAPIEAEALARVKARMERARNGDAS